MGRELRWNWKELEEDKLWSEYVVLNFSIKEKEEITNKNYRHGNNISKQQFQLEMCIIGMIVIYIPFYLERFLEYMVLSTQNEASFWEIGILFTQILR